MSPGRRPRLFEFDRRLAVGFVDGERSFYAAENLIGIRDAEQRESVYVANFKPDSWIEGLQNVASASRVHCAGRTCDIFGKN